MSFSVFGKSKMEIDSIVMAADVVPPLAAWMGGQLRGNGEVSVEGGWFATV